MLLYNPRHNAVPAEGEGQIYFPSSLAVVGARVLQAGGNVTFQDANLNTAEIAHDVVGIHVLGAPYIPEAIRLKERILQTASKSVRILLGGQVISGLTRTQFQHLFGPACDNGNSDTILKAAAGLQLHHLPDPEKTSLIPFYEKLSDEEFTKYFTQEWCLYLSQGCKYACTFCAAHRTKQDPISDQVVTVREQYRGMAVVERDLNYLAARAERLKVKHFQVYLSNLDLFQTPTKLKEFAQVLCAVRQTHPHTEWHLRGLSTAHEFMRTWKHDRETIELMIKAGLWSIGFGVDGTSKAVWRSVKKSQNQLPECIEAMRITKEELGICPEMFMVIGHDTDTPESLQNDLEFTLDMKDRFGAAPRPYVAKNIIPGNSGWTDSSNAHIVDQLLQTPTEFTNLDYACLPSPLTHPDESQRRLISDTFIKLTHIAGNTTNVVYPVTASQDERTNRLHRRLNAGKWDR